MRATNLMYRNPKEQTPDAYMFRVFNILSIYILFIRLLIMEVHLDLIRDKTLEIPSPFVKHPDSLNIEYFITFQNNIFNSIVNGEDYRAISRTSFLQC